MPKTHQIFLSLGSNLEPERHFVQAMTALRGLGDVVEVSHVYETEPVGGIEQPNFLNAAIELQTVCSPEELITQNLPTIETLLGRVRTEEKFGPRSMDIDLTLAGDFCGEIAGKAIPHPDLLEYAHVAVPMSDLAPNRPHPVTHETLEDLAKRLKVGVELKVREDIDLLGMK